MSLRKLQISLFIWALVPVAQVCLAQQPDSVVLALDDLYTLVLANHPMAKQAGIVASQGRQEVLMARGQFDPKLMSSNTSKHFKDKEYYNLWDTYLKIPTWWGIEAKAGFERNTGEYLDPSLNTDGGKGLYYAGVSVPLGPLAQGFMMDQRRASLREAQALQLMTQAERRKNLNKLLLQATKDYWYWYFTHHQYKVLQKGYELALFRFNAVRQEVQQGFMAPIDSVEAEITLQQRQIELRESQQLLLSARLTLSNHLWNSEGSPGELPEQSRPEALAPLAQSHTLEQLKEQARDKHPELEKLRAKHQQLDIGRRLAIEGFKPMVNAKYNWLLKTPLGLSHSFDVATLNQNYKFGLELSMPLIFRKERGKLKLTQLKLQDNQLDQDFEQQRILREVEASYQNLQAFISMLQLQEEMVKNYYRLLEGEKQKFENGQSSVFYMNVREGKLLEAEVKLFKMHSEYRKSYAQLLWSAGVLFAE